MTSCVVAGGPTNLVVVQSESKLFHPRLDRIPACKAVAIASTLCQHYNATEAPPRTRN